MRRSTLIAAGLTAALLLGTPVIAQDDDAAPRLLREAQRQVSAGDIDEATSSFELLLDRFAGTVEARRAGLAMAELLWQQNDKRQAIARPDLQVDVA